jgi:hypothetical protein
MASAPRLLTSLRMRLLRRRLGRNRTVAALVNREADIDYRCDVLLE